MKKISVNCPAKINLTLEIVNRREDGFHNIKSIMQTISLFDTLEIELEPDNNTEILLSGNSKDIPYDSKNLVYKACELFFLETGLSGRVKIFINKKIPIAAGLAGGSTDAAGTLYGLNKIFDNPLTREELHKLCSKLGSDLNVCLEGGCILATSRGEVIKKLDKAPQYKLTLVKPKNLGISAKEAYTKYALKTEKPQNNMTEKMLDAINSEKSIQEFLYNDLEYAIFDDYKELQLIKQRLPKSIMSGSGSTYFVLDGKINKALFDESFEIIEDLEFIPNGVCRLN